MPTYRLPVDLTWTGASGSPGVNVWNVRTTGDFPSTGELEDLSELIHDFYSTMNGIFPDTMQIKFNGVATTIEGTPQFDTSAPSWTVNGAASSNYLPPSQQICINLLTSNATRRGRGRKFIGPLHNAVLDAPTGTPGASPLAGLASAMDTLVSASSGFANGAIGVYSPADGVFRDITGYSIRDQFAVLRSRRD